MPRPVSVAMVAACPFPWPRGTPARIKGLALAMANRDHEVAVVTYHLGEPLVDPPFSVHRAREVRWYRRVAPGPTYLKMIVLNPLLTVALRRLLRTQSIDLIHAHHYEGLMVARAASRGRIPIIYDAHTTLESELPTYGMGLPSGVKRGLGRLLDRRLPSLAQHSIAVTEAVRDHLLDISALGPDQIDVVGNGVEVDLFDSVERRHRPEGAADTIIYAGNLAAYQRIDLLLESFQKVQGQRSSSRLIIATADTFDPFERQARALGIREVIDVETCSFDDLPGLLAQADIAVNPRVDCAGVPQKNLNYMAAQLPVVSFQSSATPSVHGLTGIAVEDGDTQALAAAMLKLLAQPETRRRMGAKARSAVGETSWSAQASKIETIYSEVLRKWKKD